MGTAVVDDEPTEAAGGRNTVESSTILQIVISSWRPEAKQENVHHAVSGIVGSTRVSVLLPLSGRRLRDNAIFGWTSDASWLGNNDAGGMFQERTPRGCYSQ